jgi:hypothetical protein
MSASIRTHWQLSQLFERMRSGATGRHTNFNFRAANPIIRISSQPWRQR